MKINKKAVAGLLGGGVTLTAASLGGLKLNDTLKYNNQLKHFSTHRSKLKEKLPNIGYPGWTIAKWEDLETWKEHFNNERGYIYSYTGKDQREVYQTPKEFRDACYDIITNKDKNFDSCSPSGGWCESCLMNRDWYGGNYKNEK